MSGNGPLGLEGAGLALLAEDDIEWADVTADGKVLLVKTKQGQVAIGAPLTRSNCDLLRGKFVAGAAERAEEALKKHAVALAAFRRAVAAATAVGAGVPTTKPDRSRGPKP